MEDPKQVMAYAQADFSEANELFLYHLKLLINPQDFEGLALDLGCGPGDISFRFLTAYPTAQVDALDGSRPMLDYAGSVMPEDLKSRVRFIHGKLQTISLPCRRYDLIFSNSVLHHLPEPEHLWRFIKRHANQGARVAVMDLFRPKSIQLAKTVVDTYAASEPEILRLDFYRSLLAAFTPDEIEEQLQEAELNFDVALISDRHVFISGTVAFP